MARRVSRQARRPAAASKRSPAPRRAPPTARPTAAPYSGPGRLREEPHAHMVCRKCGRIAGMELTQLDLFELELLADRRPSGWSVDGVTYSLTGFCPSCGAGSARRP